jgi:hypothetical protein
MILVSWLDSAFEYQFSGIFFEVMVVDGAHAAAR